MAARKSALPKKVRVVKYFETRDPETGEKVCVNPSEQAVEVADEKLLKELLDVGLAVSADEEPDADEE